MARAVLPRASVHERWLLTGQEDLTGNGGRTNMIEGTDNDYEDRASDILESDLED